MAVYIGGQEVGRATETWKTNDDTPISGNIYYNDDVNYMRVNGLDSGLVGILG